MAGLTASDLARLAGVSVSMISRTESGNVVPAADAYLRVLRAAGFVDGGDRVAPLSRPSAVWTVRWLLGDLLERPGEAAEWVDAWRRCRLVTDDLEVPDLGALAFRAGRSAVLADRPGIVTATSDLLVEEIARRLTDDGVDYAVTGDAALERLGSSIVGVWPVVYVADVAGAVEALAVRIRLPGERGPRVSLIEFDGASEQGRSQASDGIWFATPLQCVIDGYGGYGRMVEQAQVVLRSWTDEP